MNPLNESFIHNSHRDADKKWHWLYPRHSLRIQELKHHQHDPCVVINTIFTDVILKREDGPTCDPKHTNSFREQLLNRVTSNRNIIIMIGLEKRHLWTSSKRWSLIKSNSPFDNNWTIALASSCQFLSVSLTEREAERRPQAGKSWIEKMKW